jgi:hypothetical protein
METRDQIQDLLNKVLAEYLKMNSLDGKMERQPLRKQLRELLDKLNALQ